MQLESAFAGKKAKLEGFLFKGGSLMSDVGTFSRLAPSPAQLPVHSYFSQAVLDLEQQRCFRAGPGYVGHRLMVEEPGRFHTLAFEDQIGRAHV